MDLGLQGKIALVTGATSGVGREIALRLAAEGAALAVNYRGSAAEAELIVKEIKSKGGSAKAYQADIADFADVRVNLSNRDPNFRQVNEQPTFLQERNVDIASTIRLDRLFPGSLGLALPFLIAAVAVERGIWP